jgi:PAS domain S-box-containing protein
MEQHLEVKLRSVLRRRQSGAIQWRLPRLAVAALSLLLFAVVFALRAGDQNPADAVLVLLVVPIALCAVEFGLLGGLATGLLGLALTAVWDGANAVDVDPLGYLSRGAAFLLLGGMLGAFVDRNRALLQQFARYHDISLDLLVTAGFDGYFKQVNPAWEKALGHTQEELLSAPFMEFVHPDDRERTQAEAAKLAEGGTDTISFKNRYRLKDGSYRWLEWNARSDADEGLIYAIARDITAQKLAEQAAKEAKEAAERANRAKSEFLSRMSHELRTPLNAVLGFGQLLEVDELDRGQRESVAQILKGGRHLLELINEVLDISRIEAGNMTISLEPVHVGTTLSEVIDLIGPLAAEGDIALERPSAETADQYVLADNQRLKQVLLNLLSNAIKYNREAGSVTVSLETVSPAHLLILVTDTGKGISEGELTKLFNPFERLGAEQSSIEGTGLGLTLSKLLIEEMGGALNVESEPWIGTTFLVKLSLTKAPVETAVPATADAPSDFPNGPPGRTRTILHVEDNMANLKLVERIFAGRPEVRVVPAINGNLAFELACQHQPDLVLLDLHLPGIAGEEVLARLRDDPRTRDIPVIVVSADATEARVKNLLAAGADAYLTKPLDIERFLAVVEDTLTETVGA